MEIVPYKEMHDYEGFFHLLWLVFPNSFSLSPIKLKKWIESDSRIKDGIIGFCMLENEKIVGFVGVMDLITRNLSREIKPVGGMWGVATLPSHARKGIATSLFEKAHEYLRSRNYRFAFLSTNNTTIAHSFYRRLGYSDATVFPSAFKLIKDKSIRNMEEKTNNVDWRKISEIYEAFSQCKTGFVVRNEKYYRDLIDCGRLTNETIISNENGYLILKKEGQSLQIRENIALKTEKSSKLVQRIERMPVSIIYDSLLLDENVLRIYQKMGYVIQNKSYGLLMAKSFSDNLTFQQEYGRNFYMTGCDNIVIP